MKLERDKKYRARDGSIWRVVCVDAPGIYPVVVVNDDGSIGRLHANGLYSEGTNSGADLIAEDREPREWWLYSTRCNGWFVYDNRLGLGLTDKGEWVRVREVIE